MKRTGPTRVAAPKATATRVAAAMMLVGAALVVITVALPPAAQGSDLVILAFGALLGAVGWTLLAVRVAPEPVLGLVAALGTMVITFTTREAGLVGHGADDNEILYIWVCLYSFYFFSLRHALLQLGIVVLAYAALVTEQGASDTIGTRLVVIGSTLLVAGLIISRLRASLDGTLHELSTHARRDPLTGALNRRGLEERAALEVARARREGGPLSLLIVDVDSLKALNDSAGHPAGDEVLRIVGRVLDDQTREIDAAARVGGDEFAVLLPGSSPTEARAAAERLRVAVNSELIQRGLEVSLSIGAATRQPPHYPTLENLSADADVAVYEAKRAGGDRVRAASIPRVAAEAAG